MDKKQEILNIARALRDLLQTTDDKTIMELRRWASGVTFAPFSLDSEIAFAYSFETMVIDEQERREENR